MRTTLELSDEAYHLAKSIAHERNVSLGTVVSELVLRRLGSEPEAKDRVSLDGPFPSFRCKQTVTFEDVRALEDE